MDHDQETVRAELAKLVFREMGNVLADINTTQAGLEALLETVDGAKRDYVEARLARAKQGKLEAITLFKAMQDFIGVDPR